MAKKKEMCSSENHEPGAGIVLMKLEELNQSLQQSNDDQRNTGGEGSRYYGGFGFLTSKAD